MGARVLFLRHTKLFASVNRRNSRTESEEKKLCVVRAAVFVGSYWRAPMFSIRQKKRSPACWSMREWSQGAFLHLNEPNKNVAKVLNSPRLEGVSVQDDKLCYNFFLWNILLTKNSNYLRRCVWTLQNFTQKSKWSVLCLLIFFK